MILMLDVMGRWCFNHTLSLALSLSLTHPTGEDYGVAKNVSLHSVRVLDCNSLTSPSIIKKVGSLL